MDAVTVERRGVVARGHALLGAIVAEMAGRRGDGGRNGVASLHVDADDGGMQGQKGYRTDQFVAGNCDSRNEEGLRIWTGEVCRGTDPRTKRACIDR